MSTIIALASSKGGSGKTTTALNLAVALAEKGHATLLVDLDPQGSIGFSLARGDMEWVGLMEVLAGDANVGDALFKTKLSNLTLLPRGRLDSLDIEHFENLVKADGAIGRVLAPVRERYQYILLDTASGLGPVTRAALNVANYVLLPLQAEPLALRSLAQMLTFVEGTSEKSNPDLHLLGILPTMVKLDVDASFAVMSTVWSGFGGVFETYIPRTEVFARASDQGLPVAFLGGSLPPEAARFEMLVAEIENVIAQIEGATTTDLERPRRELI